MTRAEMLLYLKKERSRNGVRVVDAFYNVHERYKTKPFDSVMSFFSCARADRRTDSKFIERVYFEYLSLKVTSE